MAILPGVPMIRRLAAIVGLLLQGAATAAQDRVSDDQVQVVKVAEKFASAMRPYSRFLPGIREYNQHRHLAPATELRFGMVTGSFPMKPLPLAKARLESGWFWSEDIAVLDDGWFVLPESPEAEKRNADLVVSQRKAQAAKWVLDIHTPSLPPQTYLLGDLRLECRVYLAIEWGTWKGRRIMDIPTKGATTPPMDRLCSGPESIFINTRPWPRLQAYVITENGRSKRTELNGLQIASAPFMLKMATEAGVMPWSDDALVEFAFYDTSHWSKPIAAETPK
jgi:hypothetical protein